MWNKDKRFKCRHCGHYGEPNIARDMSMQKKQRVEYYCARCGNQIYEFYASKNGGKSHDR